MSAICRSVSPLAPAYVIARACEMLYGEKNRFPSSLLRVRYRSSAKALLPVTRDSISSPVAVGVSLAGSAVGTAVGVGGTGVGVAGTTAATGVDGTKTVVGTGAGPGLGVPVSVAGGSVVGVGDGDADTT